LGPELGVAVGNRRAGGKHHATAPTGALHHIARLEEHRHCPVRVAVGQAPDAVHRRDESQVLVSLGLVHDDHVYAEVLPVDFLLILKARHDLFELLLQVLELLLQVLPGGLVHLIPGL